MPDIPAVGDPAPRATCTGRLDRPPVTDLHPVVMAVPAAIRQLRGRCLVRRLSRLARLALRRAALRRDDPAGPWTKNDQGVPQPHADLFWSISHKPTYVAGVVAPHPVGIDLEPILPRPTGLYAKIATPAEWRLRREAEEVFFYRLWTAKEAVLKAEGIGLRGLVHCRVAAVHDDTALTVTFADRQWRVSQFYFDGHLAAVTMGGGAVDWRVAPIRRKLPDGGNV
jgi:4'-phosphopantetheinyl transferase